jgi:hypothetical protein
MSRSLPSALLNEFNSASLKPFYAVQFFFDSGTVSFWTGLGEIYANSTEWTGGAGVLSLSNSVENTDLTANGMTFTFNGLEASFVSIALSENYRGRFCKVFIGALGSDDQPISDLYQVFLGRMDTMSVNENGETATIQITAENVLIDLERPRIRKFTNEEQLTRFPNDNSLETIAALQDREINWGRA